MISIDRLEELALAECKKTCDKCGKYYGNYRDYFTCTKCKMQVGMMRPIAITKIFYTKIAHIVDMKKDTVAIMKGRINDNKLRKNKEYDY